MTQLVNNEGVFLQKGRHQYVVGVTAGIVQLQISVDNETTWQDMTNGLFSADEDGIVLMADAHVKAIISDTATVDISFVGY